MSVLGWPVFFKIPISFPPCKLFLWAHHEFHSIPRSFFKPLSKGKETHFKPDPMNSFFFPDPINEGLRDRSG